MSCSVFLPQDCLFNELYPDYVGLKTYNTNLQFNVKPFQCNKFILGNSNLDYYVEDILGVFIMVFESLDNCVNKINQIVIGQTLYNNYVYVFVTGSSKDAFVYYTFYDKILNIYSITTSSNLVTVDTYKIVSSESCINISEQLFIDEDYNKILNDTILTLYKFSSNLLFSDSNCSSHLEENVEINPYSFYLLNNVGNFQYIYSSEFNNLTFYRNVSIALRSPVISFANKINIPSSESAEEFQNGIPISFSAFNFEKNKTIPGAYYIAETPQIRGMLSNDINGENILNDLKESKILDLNSNPEEKLYVKFLFDTYEGVNITTIIKLNSSILPQSLINLNVSSVLSNTVNSYQNGLNSAILNHKILDQFIYKYHNECILIPLATSVGFDNVHDKFQVNTCNWNFFKNDTDINLFSDRNCENILPDSFERNFSYVYTNNSDNRQFQYNTDCPNMNNIIHEYNKNGTINIMTFNESIFDFKYYNFYYNKNGLCQNFKNIELYKDYKLFDLNKYDVFFQNERLSYKFGGVSNYEMIKVYNDSNCTSELSINDLNKEVNLNDISLTAFDSDISLFLISSSEFIEYTNTIVITSY